MKMPPFALERFFARYEFAVEYILSASDCESVALPELLAQADPETGRLWQELSLGYTESQGHPLLRQEIAALYETMSADHILIAAPEEAIFVLMNAVLAPGDHVIVTYPAYQSLFEVARGLGCDVSQWRLKATGTGWELDLQWLEDAITPRTRLLVANFPHNPTGFIPAPAQWQAIRDIAGRRDLILFGDEMYRLLEQRPKDRLPATGDCYERGVSLFGLSKTFGLPGLRIGWLATRDASLMQACATFKDYTTICSSAPSEILAIMALRAKEWLIGRSRQVIADNLALAREFFAARPNWFDWLEPLGGSIAFPRYNNSYPLEAFCRQLAENHSTLLVPGTLFDYPNHVRIGLGRKNLAAGLRELDSFLQEISQTACFCPGCPL